ncbi:NADH:flavorubredoxin reductase NorW [Pluralibacter gergoviae]|uniref:NADH:flavorubredoxin reductase NorW n=1 Tax=Pluralibacter gergoviae TaxID=61647 RepID=A0AAI9DMS5_PLUGE|nr:NADH:flavorubredoxin reductase NorW [Pluralibacter gergoviae]EKV0916527.1 NADH:flavorubredoxin reductase NorW [Pluralibacter gergoviae]EKV9908746.1 NADH:flavorubredoxin reductase NorW [Pluralibacter gergoviae]EKW7274596.1 NADH:flavorubredoxin reductase NorW [Pluralibacter gergoviae]ELD4295419.1 NADH:flavorubredoxin reductase NorW [Pluralibacter gergoviae]ELD4305670.1 NADH:flavorubredoxin reductase NorW [Pluralibacter gergoviae]
MNHGIVIIGSGFAARQLVKHIRKLDGQVPLTLIAADGMDEYNKPDLSHVISCGLSADALTLQTAGEFAEQYQLQLFPQTWITDIDSAARTVRSADRSWQYDRLVLATGARTAVPPVPGHELMLTLNSQQEYRAARQQLRDARRVLIVGGGLIGCELAMDFRLAGKTVSVVDNNASLMASLMPPEVSSRLQQKLVQSGVQLALCGQLARLEPCGGGVRATLADGREIIADAALAATGLRPETALARRAGLTVNRGIQVNSRLQTSDPHIFALGDCAEINGALLPFLQPILLSAMCLAKNLLNQTAALALPPMLVKVKTPELPLQLAGDAGRPDLSWHIVSNAGGMVAKGVDDAGKLCAFAVSEGSMKEAFALLKSLS